MIVLGIWDTFLCEKDEKEKAAGYGGRRLPPIVKSARVSSNASFYSWSPPHLSPLLPGGVRGEGVEKPSSTSISLFHSSSNLAEEEEEEEEGRRRKRVWRGGGVRERRH